MKILVTGATGFIGGAIVEKLAQYARYQITALGRKAHCKLSDLQNVTYVSFDLVNSGFSWEGTFCIHCAGLADDSASVTEFEQNNVAATQNLIEGLTGCKQFIYISSSSVYNFTDQKVKSELDVGTPTSQYGISKRKAELIVENSFIGSKQILRPRAVYGPGDNALLPRILRLVKGPIMLLPQPIAKQSSLTHIHNLVYAVELCLEKKPGQTIYFNVSDSETYNLNQVFKSIAKHKNPKIIIVPIPIFVLVMVSNLIKWFRIKSMFTPQAIAYLTNASVLNTKNIREQLNYRPKKVFNVSEIDL